MSYKYVIFDVDGTLIDPIAGVVEALNRLKIEGLELVNFRNEAIIGPPMKRTLMRLYGFDETKAANYASKFRQIYMNETLFKSKMYAGIDTLFENLNSMGIKIGIATYKRTDCAQMVINHYGLESCTDVVCGDTLGSTSIKADIIRECINMLGVTENEEVLMVGETIEDCTSAKDNNIDFCGVTYGYGFDVNSKQFKELKYLISSPIQLINIVR